MTDRSARINLLEWITAKANWTIDKIVGLPGQILHRNVYSGERLMPEFMPFVNWRRAHYERYYFAQELLKPTDVVLDLACGVGYGTAHLAEKCLSITGVDYSADTIKYALKNYQQKNCFFTTGDFFGFSTPDKFDVVVSFETIEHIQAPIEKIIPSIMARAKRLVIGSVPYREAPGKNKYHYSFYLDEARFELLHQYGKTTFYHQEKRPGFRIIKDQAVGTDPQNLIFVVEINP